MSVNNDLISRSALLEKATNVTKYDEGGWSMDLRAVPVENVVKAPAVDAGPKWFSVKDRLPEVWKDVLTHRAGGHLSIEFKCSGDGWSFDNEIMEEVTHWMPLPEPPKEG